MGAEKTLKLTMLFIVIDLLTLLAYPIVFVHGKLNLYAKSKSIPQANIVVPGSVTQDR